MYLKYTKLERRPHAQINRIRYRIMGDKGRAPSSSVVRDA